MIDDFNKKSEEFVDISSNSKAGSYESRDISSNSNPSERPNQVSDTHLKDELFSDENALLEEDALYESENGDENKSSSKKKLIILIVAVAVVIIGVLACLFFFRSSIFGKNEDPQPIEETVKTFGEQVTVNDIDISGMTINEAKAALKPVEDKLLSVPELFFVYKNEKTAITSDIIDMKVNTDKVLKEAMRLCDERPKPEDGEIPSYEPIKLTIERNFSVLKVKKLLSDLAKEINKEAKEPSNFSFDFDTHEFSFDDGEKGLRVDETATYNNFLAALNANKPSSIELTTKEVDFSKDAHDLMGKLGLMGTYSTICTNVYNSAFNMGLAMEKMDKSVIEPGEIFSFHGAVGDSMDPNNGWLSSGAWRGDKLVSESGGGICQAATTLYGCALYSGLEIIERYEHMQPSDYCPLGLDATVDYPYLDMRVRNTTNYPIYIVSHMIDSTLTMEMYGYITDEWDEIVLDSWQTSFTPMPNFEFKTDKSLKPGEYKRDHIGYSGCTASVTRTFYKNGQIVRVEELSDSSYSEVAPLYLVGPGTDTSKITGGESGFVGGGEDKPSSSSKSSSESSEESGEESSGDDSSGDESSDSSEEPDPE